MGAAALISLIMPVESRAACRQRRPLRLGAEAAAREQHDAGARVAMACRKQCVSKAFCRANARSTAVGSAPRSRANEPGAEQGCGRLAGRELRRSGRARQRSQAVLECEERRNRCATENILASEASHNRRGRRL